ncbi:MAG TPA: hypothetical protein PLC42_08115 [Parachlamydiaceae bacterium]|nr:hypothetical protein [Parachlamydiaceae bacterium]
MQPHKGLSSKDSFAPCQPADIFTHIRSPKQPLKPLQPPLLLDTLENEQEAINRLILEKPALRSIYFVAKTGKGIIIFFIFPFYFCLFRTPKWIISRILPLAFQASSKIVLKSKERLNKLVQKIALKLQVLNRLQEALKAFAPPLKSLFKETANYLMTPFVVVFKNTKKTFEKIVSAATQVISDKMEALLSVFHKMSHLMKKAADLAKESERIRSSRIKTLLIPFEESVNGFIKNLLKKSAAFIESQKKKLEELLAKAKRLKETGKRQVLKVLELVREIKEVVKEKLLEIKIELKELMLPKVEAAFLGMQKAVQILNPPIAFIAHLIQQANQKSSQFGKAQTKALQFARSCSELSKKVFKKIAVQEAIVKSFQRLFQDASSAGKNLSKKAFEIALKVKEKIKAKIRQKMQVAAQFLLGFFKRLFRYLTKIFKKIVRFFSLVCKWYRIMAKFTYYLGQEILLELQTI